MLTIGTRLAVVLMQAVKAPEFGAALKDARGGLSLAQVVAKLHRATTVLDGFSRGQLQKYESGKVPNPDPVALMYLAQVYRQTVDRFIVALAKDRELLKGSEQESPPKRGRPSIKRSRAV